MTSGLVPTIIELCLLYALVDYFAVWYLTASVITFSVSFVFSFSLRKFWVFKDNNRQRLGRQLWMYAGVFAFNILFNVSLMHFLVERIGWAYLGSQMFTDIFLGLNGFILNRTFIFKNQEDAVV